MTAIDRTIYRRMKRSYTTKELIEAYTPTAEERRFVSTMTRTAQNQLNLMLWMKLFPCLGYFPALSEIPPAVADHVRQALDLAADIVSGYDHDRTLYRHHQMVREYYQLLPYGKEARRVILRTLLRAVRTMDNPADMINAALEELIRQRYEMPAFSTLDRLTGRVRTLVYGRICRLVQRRMTADIQRGLEALFEVQLPSHRSAFSLLKLVPPSPTLSHLKVWQDRLAWLMELGAMEPLLKDIPPAIIKHFANEDVHWTRHFGPISGSDPKLAHPDERYVITSFAYGTNMEAAQMAKHMRGIVSEHEITFVNRRHITLDKLEAAKADLINRYFQYDLPKGWGDENVAAADGTQVDLYENNLVSSYHIRYGSYGGIAYHVVSSLYIALYSYFLNCGMWEGNFLIDALIGNTSEIQPKVIHSDTQGQSTALFALSYLLGIELMPRIRHWKDLKFYRPKKETVYTHIDILFKDTIDWVLLETHWTDLMQVALSVRVGKLQPSILLRKLGHESRKNHLY